MLRSVEACRSRIRGPARNVDKIYRSQQLAMSPAKGTAVVAGISVVGVGDGKVYSTPRYRTRVAKVSSLEFRPASGRTHQSWNYRDFENMKLMAQVDF